MQQSGGYVSLPGAWREPAARKTVISINDVSIPAVPALVGLLYVIGLPMWAISMLRVRTTVGAIFTDLGIAADSLDKLKTSLLVSVIVLSLLALAMLAANAWLEGGSHKASPGGETGLSISTYTSQASRVNAANWLLLLAVALALAGTVTWLSDMTTALSATQGSGGFGATLAATGKQHEALGAAAAAAAAQDMGTLMAARVFTPPGAADTSSGGVVAYCPPGCIDLGVVAKVLGLPWPCFCSMGLLGGLVEQLELAVKLLWVAVVGALLMFAGTSWQFGYLAAQGAHAARDLQDVLGGASGGSSGW